MLKESIIYTFEPESVDWWKCFKIAMQNSAQVFQFWTAVNPTNCT